MKYCLCIFLLLSIVGCGEASYSEFSRQLDGWKSYRTEDEKQKEQEEKYNHDLEEIRSANERTLETQSNRFKSLESQVKTLTEEKIKEEKEPPKVVIPQVQSPVPPVPAQLPIPSPQGNLQKHLDPEYAAPRNENETKPWVEDRPPEAPPAEDYPDVLPIPKQKPPQTPPVDSLNQSKYQAFSVSQARLGGILADLPRFDWSGQLIYRQLHCPPCDDLEKGIQSRIQQDGWNPNSFRIVLLPYEQDSLWRQKGIEGTPVIVTIVNGKETHRIVAYDGSTTALNEILAWSPHVSKQWLNEVNRGGYQSQYGGNCGGSTAIYSAPIYSPNCSQPRANCSSPLSPNYPY